MFPRLVALRPCAVLEGLFICGLLFFMLHFHREISTLEASKRNLEVAVAKIQLTQVEHYRRTVNSADVSDLSVSYNNEESQVIIYNRVPKTGSTSFMGVAYDLCIQNHFHVLHINISKNMHALSLADQARFVYNVTNWDAKKPALYHGHMAFLDFGRFSVTQKPLYINLLRKPLDRLVSYYYFLRYGDDFRPHIVRRKQGDKMTFDECVRQGQVDCDPDNMWLQIPFFCGHAASCWVPGNEWALEQAKHNLVQHYFVVGVTEELNDFVTLLEAVLPRFFKGATKLFQNGNKSHLRRTTQKIPPSPETVTRIQRSKVWKMENEFYEFALEQFQYVRKRTLTVVGGEVRDKGQQFHYEKVRPK